MSDPRPQLPPPNEHSCGCDACRVVLHWSDCAVHGEENERAGARCDCGVDPAYTVPERGNG